MVETNNHNNHAAYETNPPAHLLASLNISPRINANRHSARNVPRTKTDQAKKRKLVYGKWYTPPDTWSENYTSAKRGKAENEGKEQRMRGFEDVLLKRSDHFKALEDAIDNNDKQKSMSRAGSLDLLR
jgi:hypothetical protein